MQIGQRKVSLGAIIAAVVAAAFLAGTVRFFNDSRRLEREVQAARKAEPIRLSLDFSKTNTYVGPFRQTFHSSHGEYFRLETGKQYKTEDEIKAGLAGLRGRLRIEDTNGQAVCEQDFTTADFAPPDALGSQEDKVVPCLRIHTFKKGDYTLRIEIEQGAPALAGVPQQLVARYGLCGLEMLPPQICLVFSIGCLVLGIIPAAISFRLWRRQS